MFMETVNQLTEIFCIQQSRFKWDKGVLIQRKAS